jgi:hypothetical protein
MGGSYHKTGDFSILEDNASQLRIGWLLLSKYQKLS